MRYDRRTGNRSSSGVIVALATVLFLAAAREGTAQGGSGGGKACSETARAALAACSHEVRDDFWNAVGRCINTADANDREACIQEAEKARQEASPEDCQEQQEARLDLCDALGEAPYDPEFDPGDFVHPSDIGVTVSPNPFFPLVSGAKWVYRGGAETITVEVTGRVKEILGVSCAVVRDIVEEDGDVIEDTLDWFAQHVDGTVWYCGELARDFENGELVSLEGSWEAGRDLARPGIIMSSNPGVGDVYRQEFALGDAEDVAEVVSVTGSEVVPAASCGGKCVVTKDFTPLDPGVIEFKHYAPRVGMILEVNPETGERVELVSVHIPGR